MKKMLSERAAVSVMMIIFPLFFIFHLLVLVRIVPFTIVWGGRLKSEAEIYSFESLSLGLNLLIMAIASIKAGCLKWKIPTLIIKIAFWIMFMLFLLNIL